MEWKELTPAEEVARGLRPAGPLAPAVTSPDPAKNEQAIRSFVNPIEQAVSKATGGVLASPQGFYGPGLLANLESKITGAAPQDVYKAGTRFLEGALPWAEQFAQLASGGMAGFGKRMLGAAAFPSFNSLLRGEDPGTAAVKGGVGAGLNLAGEGAAKALGGVLWRASAARAALKDYKAKKAVDEEVYAQLKDQFKNDTQGYKDAVAQYKDTIQAARTAHAKAEAQRALEHATATQEAQAARQAQADKIKAAKVEFKQAEADKLQAHETTVAGQQAADATRMAGDAEVRAGKLMDSIKADVPAFKDFPSDSTGILDMARDRGKTVLSESFDAAMQGVAERGAGRMIQLPEATVRALKIPMRKGPLSGTPSGVMDDSGNILVDAADAAKAVLGKGSKYPGEYREVVQALDKEGIGDPAARAEYAHGIGYIDFINKAKAVVGGAFKPENIAKALDDYRMTNIITRRGIGGAVRGPFAEAARDLPQPSPEIPTPPRGVFQPPAGEVPPRPGPFVRQPYENPPDLVRPKAPVAPEAPPDRPEPDIGTMRIPYLPGFGGAGHMLNFGLHTFPYYTKAPMSEAAQTMESILPSLLATLAREGFQQGTSTGD